MRYDQYSGATVVASHDFPDGPPPALHPNKGRLLKEEPPAPRHRQTITIRWPVGDSDDLMK